MQLTIHTDDRDEAIAILAGIDPRQQADPAYLANDGRDQALEYHMEDRAVLVAGLNRFARDEQLLRQQLAIAGDEIRDLIEDERAALNELGEARVFVEKAERLLAGIGVTVDADERGEPKLSINIDELLNYVQLRVAAA